MLNMKKIVKYGCIAAFTSVMMTGIAWLGLGQSGGR